MTEQRYTVTAYRNADWNAAAPEPRWEGPEPVTLDELRQLIEDDWEMTIVTEWVSSTSQVCFIAELSEDDKELQLVWAALELNWFAHLCDPATHVGFVATTVDETPF